MPKTSAVKTDSKHLLLKLLGIILAFLGIKVYPYIAFSALGPVISWAALSDSYVNMSVVVIVSGLFGLVWLLGATITIFLPAGCLISQKMSHWVLLRARGILLFCLLSFILPLLFFLWVHQEQLRHYLFNG
ncbi:MAG: hypothetical protein AB7P76_00895 [Candidatus Melainabacteria bacterium]